MRVFYCAWIGQQLYGDTQLQSWLLKLLRKDNGIVFVAESERKLKISIKQWCYITSD
ncbi:hypothetical protein HU000_00565 [Staphylococcus sp. SS60]|nr:hypothetical protein [Staphylococcus singaporensis]